MKSLKNNKKGGTHQLPPPSSIQNEAKHAGKVRENDEKKCGRSSSSSPKQEGDERQRKTRLKLKRKGGGDEFG